MTELAIETRIELMLIQSDAIEARLKEIENKIEMVQAWNS